MLKHISFLLLLWASLPGFKAWLSKREHYITPALRATLSATAAPDAARKNPYVSVRSGGQYGGNWIDEVQFNRPYALCHLLVHKHTGQIKRRLELLVSAESSFQESLRNHQAIGINRAYSQVAFPKGSTTPLQELSQPAELVELCCAKRESALKRGLKREVKYLSDDIQLEEPSRRADHSALKIFPRNTARRVEKIHSGHRKERDISSGDKPTAISDSGESILPMRAQSMRYTKLRSSAACSLEELRAPAVVSARKQSMLSSQQSTVRPSPLPRSPVGELLGKQELKADDFKILRLIRKSAPTILLDKPYELIPTRVAESRAQSLEYIYTQKQAKANGTIYTMFEPHTLIRYPSRSPRKEALVEIMRSAPPLSSSSGEEPLYASAARGGGDGGRQSGGATAVSSSSRADLKRIPPGVLHDLHVAGYSPYDIQVSRFSSPSCLPYHRSEV
jgi:hypothetical protein